MNISIKERRMNEATELLNRITSEAAERNLAERLAKFNRENSSPKELVHDEAPEGNQKVLELQE
jgi:hypothetical protein